MIPEQPIKPTVLQQLTGHSLDTVCLDQPASTTAHPQLSSLLKPDSTNALVGGGIGTFTNLMDYQKASLVGVNDSAVLQLANGAVSATGETISPNSTSGTSGLADLSWASNDSAVTLKLKIFI